MKWEKQAINPVGEETNKPYKVTLWRARVPGGWLVLTSNSDSVTFIPDPNHGWDWTR